MHIFVLALHKLSLYEVLTITICDLKDNCNGD